MPLAEGARRAENRPGQGERPDRFVSNVTNLDYERLRLLARRGGRLTHWHFELVQTPDWQSCAAWHWSPGAPAVQMPALFPPV